ncbi:outer membrane beta-barrel protein [Mesoterricola sediminis]|uniref:Outer membrane protein beta-barrel domain-containing protein n=1 Tax=Mesoterricola sediminis TaxID=2927980 RepID=A0AA48GYX5_9BACT|nr:outer membrane beta-barrel protein [Mesoterricola sediminis]BDU76965.1 hypothetical protein METESE_19230 [Mesoterricola sediminis]
MYRRLLAVSLLGSTLAFAAQGDQWLVLKGAYTRFDNSVHLKEQGGLGIGYGSWLTDNVGLDFSLIRSDLKSDLPTATGSGTQHQLLGSVLIGFHPEGYRAFPYFSAGIGGTRIDRPFSGSDHDTTRLSYHAGLGAQFRVGSWGTLTLDSKYVRTQALVARNDWVTTVGFGFGWGNGPR